MIKQKFELIPYHNNILSSKKNIINKNVINNVTESIKNIVNNCGAVLMQECNNFVDFSGRDIDTFIFQKINF